MPGLLQTTQQTGQPPGGMEVVQDDADALNVAVKSFEASVKVTPVISAAAIYAAGDNVGGLLTFANVAREAGSGAVLKDVTIVDDDGEDAALELWLFDQTFTAGADNDAWSPSEADLENLLTIVTTADGAYFAAGATYSAAVIEVSRGMSLVGTSLFGRLVTRGTPTYTAVDDLSVRVNVLQD